MSVGMWQAGLDLRAITRKGDKWGPETACILLLKFDIQFGHLFLEIGSLLFKAGLHLKAGRLSDEVLQKIRGQGIQF